MTQTSTAQKATTDPIHEVIARWHQLTRGELPGGLDELIAEDCTFYSPIVFTPQKGKAMTILYLQAAGQSFGGEPADAANASFGADKDSPSSFHYTREVLDGHCAVLEFETEMDGKHVNGIDMITCNDSGQIVEFKVLIRPLQAINAVHAKMQAMLEKMKTN